MDDTVICLEKQMLRGKQSCKLESCTKGLAPRVRGRKCGGVTKRGLEKARASERERATHDLMPDVTAAFMAP